MRLRTIICLLSLMLPLSAGAVGEPPGDDSPIVEGGMSLNHSPPPSCTPYRELDVSVLLEADTPGEAELWLHFREIGEGGFYDMPMDYVGGSLYRASIPARVVGNLGVEYYVSGKLGGGAAMAGSPLQPFLVATAYAFQGEVPEELPGDGFLHQVMSLVEEDLPAEEPPEPKPGAGPQILILLILGAIGFLIYQRIGAR